MKKVILSVLIIVGLVCGCSSKESEPEKNVEIILDVQQFCGMSEAELIEKWENQNHVRNGIMK